MQRHLITAAVIAAASLLAGCQETAPTGNACLGQNNDSLVEYIGGSCKAGDIIATKHPAYFCDFNHTVVFNSFNSAICVYTGKQAVERVQAEKSEANGKPQK